MICELQNIFVQHQLWAFYSWIPCCSVITLPCLYQHLDIVILAQAMVWDCGGDICLSEPIDNRHCSMEISLKLYWWRHKLLALKKNWVLRVISIRNKRNLTKVLPIKKNLPNGKKHEWKTLKYLDFSIPWSTANRVVCCVLTWPHAQTAWHLVMQTSVSKQCSARLNQDTLCIQVTAERGFKASPQHTNLSKTEDEQD